MPAEIRCPECKAKLRFDQEPEADEVVECPKCGHEIDMAALAMGGGATPAKKPAKAAEKAGKTATAEPPVRKKKPTKPSNLPTGPNDANIGVKRKVKKKKSNKKFMTIMIAGALVLLLCVGGLGYLLFSTASKMEELMSSVPGECNLVRGLNTGQMSKYPGFKQEFGRQFAGPVAQCWEGIATGLALPAGEAVTPDYAIIARSRPSGNTVGTLFVYRTRAKLKDKRAIGAALGGVEQGEYFRLPATAGALNGALVYCPTDRLIVVAPAGPMQADMMAKSVAARATPTASFWPKTGRTGRKVMTGQIWTLVRQEGALQGYVSDMTKILAEEFGTVTQAADKTPLFGMYCTYGATGVKFGMAMQCDSPETATACANSLKNSELAKGDDGEIPRSLKKTYSYSSTKDFREFISNFKFSTSGDCAYFESKMLKEKATQVLQAFNNPSVAMPQ